VKHVVMMREANVDQAYIRFVGQRGHPKKAVVRCATAGPCGHIATANTLLHANVTPRRPCKPPCRHQALCGAAKDRSRQPKASGERPSRRSDRGQGGLLISRPGNGPRGAWRGLGGATLIACRRAIRNRRSVEACGRRRPPSSRKAQRGTDGNQGAALLGVWLTGRFTIPFAAACGWARWYSDRSRR